MRLLSGKSLPGHFRVGWANPAFPTAHRRHQTHPPRRLLCERLAVRCALGEWSKQIHMRSLIKLFELPSG